VRQCSSCVHDSTQLQAKPDVLSEEAAAARLVTDVDVNPEPPASPGLGRLWCAADLPL
jgi:hypothetical protein